MIIKFQFEVVMMTYTCYDGECNRPQCENQHKPFQKKQREIYFFEGFDISERKDLTILVNSLFVTHFTRFVCNLVQIFRSLFDFISANLTPINFEIS